VAAYLYISLVVALDQLSKLWVVRRFALHESREVVPGFFNLTHIVNYGAAFGFLNSGTPAAWRTAFFSVVALAAICLMLAFLRQARDEGRRMEMAVSLVAGGAAGNLIDRLRLGYVVDFLDFYIGRHHWPAFNVADSAITVGVALFLLETFIATKKDKNNG